MPIYWAILTYMLLKPADELGSFWFPFPNFDKIIHLSIFGFLGFCFMVVFQKTRFIVFLQVILCYAFGTEILQGSMGWGRSLEFLDVVADTTGCVLGYLVYYFAKKHFYSDPRMNHDK